MRLVLLAALLLGAAGALQPPASQEVGYAFEYGVRDERSGTLYAHHEFRHGIVTTGQYTVHLPDGRIQTVKYTADHDGYRATVSYEGLAHHPDKIIDTPSKPTNYPPALAGRLVPFVGNTVLNRPSTIPQATSVSHTRFNHYGHSHDTSTSSNFGVPRPDSPETVPTVPILIKGIPGGTASTGNFQSDDQYSSAPTSPHLLLNSNVQTSHERTPNSYLRSPQNAYNVGSRERPFVPSVSPGRYPVPSGESDRQSFSVPLHQHQGTSPSSGRYASASFIPKQYPNVLKLKTIVPVVPFTINDISQVPARTEDVSVTGVNVSSVSHAPNILATVSGNIPVVPYTSRVPFLPDPNQRNPPRSFPQHSQQISIHSSPPSFSSNNEFSITEQSQNQQVPIRNTFRVPYKLQSGEQDFERLPQSFDANRQHTFSPANTKNFNEYYNIPSSPQTRPRKLPPNTFIPSAIDPYDPRNTAVPVSHDSATHLENKFPQSENDLKQISPHLHEHGQSGSSRFAGTNFNQQPANSFSSDHRGNRYETSNHNQGDQSFSVSNISRPANTHSVFIAHEFNNQEVSQNSPGQNSHANRPTPKPIIVPNQELFLPPPETKYSSGVGSPYAAGLRSQNVIFRPINEIDPILFKKPFIIDPDASVFHNEPSIIVDYSHRGTSHEDDSNTVSLTAPYVFVGGAYSPNPASKFASNSRLNINRNSVAAHGIAPPDPADTGNILLSPGFLPPHLAKLQEHREEIRTAPTPEPVQLKLAPRRNLEITGVERKQLPLRNQPDTFGEGTIHTFRPNSISKTLKSGKQRRNILQLSDIEDSDRKPENRDEISKTSKAVVENSPPSFEDSSKKLGEVETRPNIRNG